MTELRWGIAGPGGIAHAFARDLRVAGLRLEGVASRSRDRAAAFAAEFDIPRVYGSYQELAADPEIDIVYIATPHPQHVEPALLMLTHGKHVLVEKAFTANAAEAELIRATAERHGLLALEAMWTRYLPHMTRLREIIASGTLGELRNLQADHTQLLPADPQHRINNLELGGGALLDLGIYPISFAWDLFGAPERIVASGTLGPTGADQSVQATLHYSDGRMASTFSSSVGRGSNTAAVIGSEASVLIDPVWYTATSFRVVTPRGEIIDEFASTVDGRGMQFQAIAAEKLVAENDLTGGLLPIAESVQIMHALDDIRSQIGVVYPSDSADQV